MANIHDMSSNTSDNYGKIHKYFMLLIHTQLEQT